MRLKYKRKKAFPWLFMLSCMLAISPVIHCQAKDPSHPLVRLLLKGAHKYNLFFTFEGAYDGVLSYPNITSFVEGGIEPQNVPDFISKVSQFMPSYKTVVDAQNPNVIHFVDSRLIGKANYYLNTNISNISFEGNFIDYIKYLDFDHGVLQCNNYHDFGSGPIKDDAKLKVSFHAAHATVREALSCFPSDYCRILWISACDIQSGRVLIKAPGTNMDSSPKSQ